MRLNKTNEGNILTGSNLRNKNLAVKIQEQINTKSGRGTFYILIDPISCKILFKDKNYDFDKLSFKFAYVGNQYTLTPINNAHITKLHLEHGSLWFAEFYKYLVSAIRIAVGELPGPYIPFDREKFRNSMRPSSWTMISNRLPSVEYKEENLAEEPEEALGPSVEPVHLPQLQKAAKTSETALKTLLSDLSHEQKEALLITAVNKLNNVESRVAEELQKKSMRPARDASCSSYRIG